MHATTVSLQSKGYDVILLIGDDDTRYIDEILQKEVERAIVPLIEQGINQGRAELKDVEYIAVKENTVIDGKAPVLVASWKKMLPWWDPRNEDWALTPFFGKIIEASSA